MPGPFTVVTLADEDGDTFPVRLPGIYRNNRQGDFDAAVQVVQESQETNPRGSLSLASIEYVGEVQ